MSAVLASAAVLAVSGAGCETTREQAAKFGRGGNAAFRVEGLEVRRANRDVRVVESSVISDVNGTAVVAVLRNAGRAALADVPLAMVVKGAGGRALARNDEPGLERGLTHAPLLPVGRDVPWVHDQVIVAGGRATAAEVTPGAGRPAPGDAGANEIAISAARLEGDPASGITAIANAVNRSGVAQRDLLIVCVARRGGRVVAAGRAIVPSIRAGGRAEFQVFFIGDPTGAELTFDAQPTTFD
ncbi:hypothetical protein [Conexibacter woesei]|uniref:Uncharacterized protein n=1 Tax=Conexibacter woesei (strain DSM 14684 / CCUG 47730 / CIP 108061 / JCM 11494 / NBRC 100937 / ID131577) TaxID=469383 RepID=D3FA88_CONWI|nr:hypothetical protein [Conexibacter woesei]ADB53183.1 hypothetical protein Cwoe_4770 [Conexibacter woesei DSM 14684]